MSFGLNILAQYVNDQAALMAWLLNAKSAATVVMDSPSLAASIKRALPDTTVIHRSYHPHDAKFYETLTPQQFLAAYAPSAAEGVALQVLNEPSPGDVPAFLTWLEGVVAACPANVTLVLANFAVGNPYEKDILAGVYDRLIKLVATTRHKLGLHEYFRVNPTGEHPWYCGRFEFWDERAKQLGYADFARNHIVITEHGRDWGGGPLDGWRNTGWTEQRYFDLLASAQTIYAPYDVPVCLFCWGTGAGGDWTSFNIQDAATLQRLLSQYNQEHTVADSPTYPDGTKPIDAEVALAYGITLRARPSTGGMIIRSLVEGERVTVYEQPSIWRDGYYWLRVHTTAGEDGWAVQWYNQQDVFKPYVAPTNRVLLNVPYASQWGWPSARTGMCGPASAWMIAAADRTRRSVKMPAEITVDSIADWIGLKGSAFSSMADVRNALVAYGVYALRTLDLTIARIKQEIDAGRPVIALGQYSHLSQRSDKTFGGGHILVVVGYDDASIICNDPDYPGSSGRQVAYNIGEFEEFLSQTAQAGNTPNQGIVVRFYANPAS